MNKELFCIIPARGGSKRLPKKNILQIAGKPLIAHTILAAQNCSFINECYVSTEDKEIAEISVEWGSKVIPRPFELAGGEISSEDVIYSALLYLKKINKFPDYFVLLQPTSPLRNAQHITLCIEKFFNMSANSIISVKKVNSGNKVFKIDYIKEILLLENNDTEFYCPNGAIYLTSSEVFMQKKSFYIPPVVPFFMSAEDSIDINNFVDFQLASILLKN